MRQVFALIGIIACASVLPSSPVSAGARFLGLGYLPGGSPYSSALDVSADGSTVVGYSQSASGQEAFRWTSDGGMVGLGDLPGGAFSSIATGVSADGSTVVGQSWGAAGTEAFIWDMTHGMREFDAVLSDLGLGPELTGWRLVDARAISDDGFTIAGYGTNPSGYTEAWIATIPEPSTASLLALGLVGIAAMRRRGAA